MRKRLFELFTNFVHNSAMAKQDSYTRYTIRVPSELYARIQSMADSAGRSMNAEIVNRLERSIAEPPRIPIGDRALVQVSEKRSYGNIQDLATAAFKKALEELSFEGIIGGMDEPTLPAQSQEQQKNKP